MTKSVCHPRRRRLTFKQGATYSFDSFETHPTKILLQFGYVLGYPQPFQLSSLSLFQYEMSLKWGFVSNENLACTNRSVHGGRMEIHINNTQLNPSGTDLS